MKQEQDATTKNVPMDHQSEILAVGLPGICSPMHGIDFSQMTPQRSSCTHLDSADGVNISCDLQNNKYWLISDQILFQPKRKITMLNVTCDSVASAHAFLASWKAQELESLRISTCHTYMLYRFTLDLFLIRTDGMVHKKRVRKQLVCYSLWSDSWAALPLGVTGPVHSFYSFLITLLQLPVNLLI